MFCPQCGLQQISDETRFCSRCGIPLTGLAQWLEQGGSLEPRGVSAPTVVLSERRRGTRQGAKMMFIGGVIMPIFFVMSIIAEGPLPLVIPLTVFLAGLFWMLYFRLFGEEVPSVKGKAANQLPKGTTAQRSFQPPARNQLEGQERRGTNEMVAPPSVTDHTTNLLNRK